MTELTNSFDPQTTILGKPNTWSKFRTSIDFSLHIETVASEQGITCTDAILNFCETHGLEPSDISGKVNQSLREKLAEEFRSIGYLPKVAKL